MFVYAYSDTNILVLNIKKDFLNSLSCLLTCLSEFTNTQIYEVVQLIANNSKIMQYLYFSDYKLKPLKLVRDLFLRQLTESEKKNATTTFTICH